MFGCPFFEESQPLLTARQIFRKHKEPRGRILYLKKWEDLDGDQQSELKSSGICNHPVLILGKSVTGEGYFDICLVELPQSRLLQQLTDSQLTTLNDQDADQYREGRRKDLFLPIYPKKPTEKGGIQLFIEDGRDMPKDGYISLSEVFRIHQGMMRDFLHYYGDGQYRLTDESFNIVADKFGYPPIKPVMPKTRLISKPQEEPTPTKEGEQLVHDTEKTAPEVNGTGEEICEGL